MTALENWHFFGENGYFAVWESRVIRIEGYTKEGKRIRTAPVLVFDPVILEATVGKKKKYKLGKMNPCFEQWILINSYPLNKYRRGQKKTGEGHA